MKTVYSPDHRFHFPQGELSGGAFVRPFECPERWQYIVDALKGSGYTEFLNPDALDESYLLNIHSAGYLDFLKTAWSQWQQAGFSGDALPTVFPARRMQQREPVDIDGRLGYYAMALETAITETTWKAVYSSAACAQTAARLVAEGDACAFSLCRPPGHHAAYDLYGGYCFINNAAVAAEVLLAAGKQRVSILDVDFHHGNGTQDIFYQRNDVQFLSLHGEPKEAFPHFLGYADEIGEGAGEGFNINYPLPRGCPYQQWLTALDDALDKVNQYDADALVISLGVDTFEKDPISFFKLKQDDFYDYGARIAQLNKPTVFVMEGGYAVEEIGVNTVNVLNGFLK